MRSYINGNIRVVLHKPKYPCLKISSYGTVYLVTHDDHAVAVLTGDHQGASTLGDVTNICIEDLKPYTGPAIVLEP